MCISSMDYTKLLPSYGSKPLHNMSSNTVHQGNRTTYGTSPLKLLFQHNSVQHSFGLYKTNSNEILLKGSQTQLLTHTNHTGTCVAPPPMCTGPLMDLSHMTSRQRILEHSRASQQRIQSNTTTLKSRKPKARAVCQRATGKLKVAAEREGTQVHDWLKRIR